MKFFRVGADKPTTAYRHCIPSKVVGNICVFAVAFAALLPIRANSGPHEEIVSAYTRGDDEAAIMLLKPLVDQGKTEAENLLSILYLRSWGAAPKSDTQDLVTGQTADAFFLRAWLKYQGAGDSQSYKAVVGSLENAWNNYNDQDAATLLYWIYTNSDLSVRDYKMAAALRGQASRKGLLLPLEESRKTTSILNKTISLPPGTGLPGRYVDLKNAAVTIISRNESYWHFRPKIYYGNSLIGEIPDVGSLVIIHPARQDFSFTARASKLMYCTEPDFTANAEAGEVTRVSLSFHSGEAFCNRMYFYSGNSISPIMSDIAPSDGAVQRLVLLGFGAISDLAFGRGVTPMPKYLLNMIEKRLDVIAHTSLAEIQQAGVAVARAQAERERVAIEGDDSVDDLACKRRNLKPSTLQYQKCRDDLVSALIGKQQREERAALKKAQQEQQAQVAVARPQEVVAIKAQEDRRTAEMAAREAAAKAKSAIIIDIVTAGVAKAKDQCAALGFAPNTEKFGACVLQLTK